MSLTTPCEKHVDESCSLRKRSKTWKADHDFSEVLQTEHQDKGRTNLYTKSCNKSTCCITFIYQHGKTHLSSNFLLPLTEVHSYILETLQSQLHFWQDFEHSKCQQTTKITPKHLQRLQGLSTTVEAQVIKEILFCETSGHSHPATKNSWDPRGHFFIASI